ncbi:hypothetical protein LINGRAHAP2_LOCUS7585, partial [Linum grandiflorum]
SRRRRRRVRRLFFLFHSAATAASFSSPLSRGVGGSSKVGGMNASGGKEVKLTIVAAG